MKKYVLFTLLAVLLLSTPSFCSYIQTAFLANDLMISQQPGQGNSLLSLKYEYLNGEDMGAMVGNTYTWRKANDWYFVSNVYTLKYAYGLSDDLSVRLTVPYVQNNLTAIQTHVEGVGVGDVRLEGLFSLSDSLLLNAGLKLATGKRIGETESDQLPTGTGNVDILLSLISEGKMNGVALRGLVGYNLRCPVYMSGIDYDTADNILLSGLAQVSASDTLDYGAELWMVATPGKDSMSSAGEGTLIDYTDNTYLNLSPFIACRKSDDLLIKGVIDIPLAGNPSQSFAQIQPYSIVRGLTVSLGVDWKI